MRLLDCRVIDLDYYSVYAMCIFVEHIEHSDSKAGICLSVTDNAISK